MDQISSHAPTCLAPLHNGVSPPHAPMQNTLPRMGGYLTDGCDIDFARTEMFIQVGPTASAFA